MDTIRQGEKQLDDRVTSRYTVVLAAAKRARQITDGAHPLTYAPTDRAVSIAVKEMNEGKLRLKVQEDFLDGKYDRIIKDQQRYRGIVAVSKDDLREDLKDNYDKVYTAKTEDDDTEIELFRETAFDDDVAELDDIAEKDDYNMYNDGDGPEGDLDE